MAGEVVKCHGCKTAFEDMGYWLMPFDGEKCPICGTVVPMEIRERAEDEYDLGRLDRADLYAD